MRKLLFAVALLGATFQTAEAAVKPLWFTYQGFTVLDRKYVGKKLAAPVPKNRPVAVRYREPARWSDDWYDRSFMECTIRFRGTSFVYVNSVNGWLCLEAKL